MIDITGKKYGMLTVVKEINSINTSSRGSKLRRWKVSCDCGAKKEIDQFHLTRSYSGTRSCGCVSKRKLYKTKNTDHYRRLYNVWHSMLARCEKTNNSDYHKYGQRGITVSIDWHDFSKFYNDMFGTYEPGLTIERIDVNGNYCKDNCTWIPNADQAKNRRSTIWIDGLCAKDYCKLNKIPYQSFTQRKKQGLSVDDFVKKYSS